MKRFEFPGSQGHNLSARLDVPDCPPLAYALFAHCFTCGKDLQPANRIVQALNDDGIAVLRFDFTGLGKSEGKFEDTNFTSNVADLLVAADYMRENLQAPSLMIGHSLGGTAVLVAAGKVPETKAVVTIGAPSNTTNVMKQFGCDIEKIDNEGCAEVELAGRPFTIRKQFLDDLRAQDIEAAVHELKKPLLVCHSPIDDTVSIDHAGKIFVAARHPKSFLSLNTSDHLLFAKGAAEYAARSLAAWASAYLPQREEKEPTEKGVVIVEENGVHYQQRVHIGKHTIITDEPESIGGKDTGPDPYGLLLASLGTCTAVTLRMYANHKKLPMTGMDIHLKHERIHAEDCQTCETKDGNIGKITREIVIHGDELTQDQRARIIQIADKCPVHHTLEGEIVVETVEKEAV